MSDISWDFSVGRAASGEDDCIIRRIDLSTPKPPLVFCHQHQTGAAAILKSELSGNPYYMKFFKDLAEDYTIAVTDLGYTGGGAADLWGNSTNVQRVADAKNMLQTYAGTSGPITLVTVSHGNLAAMNYTLANGAASVAAVCAITPALSLNSLKSVNGGAYASAINSRYGGNYTDAAYGLNYSPHYYRHLYPATSVPTALFTASDDDIVLGPFANDFVTQWLDGDGRSIIRRYDVGALPHGEDAIVAAIPGALDWLRGNREK